MGAKQSLSSQSTDVKSVQPVSNPVQPVEPVQPNPPTEVPKQELPQQPSNSDSKQVSDVKNTPTSQNTELSTDSITAMIAAFGMVTTQAYDQLSCLDNHPNVKYGVALVCGGTGAGLVGVVNEKMPQKYRGIVQIAMAIALIGRLAWLERQQANMKPKKQIKQTQQ